MKFMSVIVKLNFQQALLQYSVSAHSEIIQIHSLSAEKTCSAIFFFHNTINEAETNNLVIAMKRWNTIQCCLNLMTS